MSHDIDPATYRKAAQVIRDGGFAKGAFGSPLDDRSPHCVVGALRLITGSHRQMYLFLPTLADLIGGPQPCPCEGYGCGLTSDAYVNVTRWNDQPERTADQVITLLEQAAEKLEAEL